MSLSSEEIERYKRHLLLHEVGGPGQQKLKASRVLVVGAGGLGAPMLQYLAAAGVGCIGIVDDDVVSLSNLHRQVLYDERDIGFKKVTVAFEKLSRLNHSIRLDVHDMRVSPSNVFSLLEPYDCIVDCSDNFPTRYLLNDACVILDKPLVSGAIYKFEGQVSVFNYRGGPTSRCLFPEPPPPGLVPSCAEGGVLGVLPGIVGCVQALETVKLILGKGEPLIGRLPI